MSEASLGRFDVDQGLRAQVRHLAAAELHHQIPGQALFCPAGKFDQDGLRNQFSASNGIPGRAGFGLAASSLQDAQAIQPSSLTIPSRQNVGPPQNQPVPSQSEQIAPLTRASQASRVERRGRRGNRRRSRGPCGSARVS